MWKSLMGLKEGRTNVIIISKKKKKIREPFLVVVFKRSHVQFYLSCEESYETLNFIVFNPCQ